MVGYCIQQQKHHQIKTNCNSYTPAAAPIIFIDGSRTATSVLTMLRKVPRSSNNEPAD